MYSFLVKRWVAHEVHQLMFRTSFSVLTKFSMPNGSHVDAHRIYDLTVVRSFTCTSIFLT